MIIMMLSQTSPAIQNSFVSVVLCRTPINTHATSEAFSKSNQQRQYDVPFSELQKETRNGSYGQHDKGRPN